MSNQGKPTGVTIDLPLYHTSSNHQQTYQQQYYVQHTITIPLGHIGTKTQDELQSIFPVSIFSILNYIDGWNLICSSLYNCYLRHIYIYIYIVLSIFVWWCLYIYTSSIKPRISNFQTKLTMSYIMSNIKKIIITQINHKLM